MKALGNYHHNMLGRNRHAFEEPNEARRFIAMTREARFRLVKRLNPGELWFFDNRRTLHARNAFDPTSGARHFQGCYIDRDELLSRILVLQR